MKTVSAEPRLNLHPHDRQVQVRDDGTLSADTSHAIGPRERGYPSRQYIPRDDMRMALLTPSEIASRYPFKAMLLTSRLANIRTYGMTALDPKRPSRQR